MEVIQLNLNHCEVAQQLIRQASAENKCDVAIIAEPFRVPFNNGNWATDKAKMAAIWVMSKYPIQKLVASVHEGFVIAEINGIFFCSCYAPPRWTMEQFDDMLDKLTDELIGRKPVVIGGDFNAWAVEWGSKRTNPRGYSLLEALSKLDVVLMNVGSTSTFRKNGRESIIDVTFCSPTLAITTGWRVCDSYTHSDHQAIRFCVGKKYREPIMRVQRNCGRKWKTKAFDKELFTEALRGERSFMRLDAEELTEVLARACDTAMPRKREPARIRRPAYWWNEEIRCIRAKCLRARRCMSRAKCPAEREERRETFKEARAALKRAIALSKRNCFKELCRDADANPWGEAYRVAIAKLKGQRTPREMCPEKLKSIIDGLFPQHGVMRWPPIPREYTAEEVEIVPVSNEELSTIAKAMKLNKAPGPDGIPNVALKAAIETNPEMFRDSMQTCLEQGHFPAAWKRQKLVLLPKPGKPPGEPSSYRPICLLDTLGKLLEQIIINRLEAYTEGEHGLSNMQFGFRKGRSTVDAIKALTERTERALKQKRWGNRYCVIVTIDVKNAFNSASWEAIANSLYRMRVPQYLCKILRSYFEDRILIYDTEVGEKAVKVTAGVPQGSKLGPILWNGMYNDVLTLELPSGVEIIGFADDIVLTATGKSLVEVEMLATDAIDRVERWMNEAKMQIAHQKTEMVLFCNCKKIMTAEIFAGGHKIKSKRAIKYLGVMVDDRLRFNNHVDYVSEKAAKALSALSTIMPNNAGPRSSKRRLLASVVTSVMRYAGPAWCAALETKRNSTELRKVYRLSAMRVASSYRTISYEAVCVIAGMIPIEIILAGDSERYEHRQELRQRPNEALTNEERLTVLVGGQRPNEAWAGTRINLLRRWQQRWDDTSKGRWTNTLIPNISEWMNRNYGEVNFHLSQFLSGHGCFRKYLHRCGHARSPLCPACPEREETPEHVVFECSRFMIERQSIFASTRTVLTAQNVVHEMCKSKSVWDAVNSAVTAIMKTLQHRWREDQERVSGESSNPLE